MLDAGAWVGLISGLGGVAMAVVIALISLLMTIPAVLLPIGITVFVFRSLAKSAQAERELLEKGTAAVATIVSVTQTGVYFNNRPQIAILLSVAMPDGSTRSVQVNKYLALIQIPQAQPGRVVEVRYDPADPSKVAIVGL